MHKILMYKINLAFIQILLQPVFEIAISFNYATKKLRYIASKLNKRGNYIILNINLPSKNEIQNPEIIDYTIAKYTKIGTFREM